MDTKISPRGKGYDDGVKGLLGIPPHEDPKNKNQEEENRQYKEGWNEGSAVFRKKRKG